MNLILLILLPLLTALAILFAKGLKQTRTLAFSGSGLQLMMALLFFIQYKNERAAGNQAPMLFESNYTWFQPLNINFHIGIDGISIAMILLTAFVVLAGILALWGGELRAMFPSEAASTTQEARHGRQVM